MDEIDLSADPIKEMIKEYLLLRYSQLERILEKANVEDKTKE